MGLKAVILVPSSGAATIPITTSTYTVLPSTGLQIIGVSVAAAATIKLPATPSTGQIVVVQDWSMLAGTNNITVDANGNTIDIPSGNASTYVIGANGTDVWLNWKGGGKWGVLA